MLAINKALSEISFRIPRPILEAVFLRRTNNWRQTPDSIDEIIMSTVIRPRVMVDSNLTGGAEIYVPLDGIPYERTDDFTSVYRIPKERTQNRSILSVLNITFANPRMVSSYGIAAGQRNTTMLQAGSSVMDAHGSIPVASTAAVSLIGENVVMVRDTIILPANIYLRCTVENDSNMSHLQLRSYRPFSDLVTLAVKSYIYNEYVIRMDLGELFGGQNLGKFKEIIETYADSEELYQTFLTEKWQKIQMMNDNETMTRYIRTKFGGGR